MTRARSRRTAVQRLAATRFGFVLRPLVRDVRHALLPGLLVGFCGSALAGPQGEVIVGGQGAVRRPDANTTVIQQSSRNLAVDWQSFNVGRGQLVDFQQPGAGAHALNRIFDQAPSEIFGRIQANGSVTLLNPNGVYFRPGSQVDVNGLVAAGARTGRSWRYGEAIPLADLNRMLDEGYVLETIDAAGGELINQGIIEAGEGGVALVGKTVRNEGVIVATLGRVQLVAGERATVDFDGDGLLRFAVDKEVIDNPDGAEAQVENSGVIEGSDVLLTARAAQGVFDQAINNSGVIKAARIDRSGGSIRLVGLGPGASVLNTGELDASGSRGGDVAVAAAGTTLIAGSGSVAARGVEGAGGTVELTGQRVGLVDQARIDVSGATDGGTALIGGDYRGANVAVRNAERTVVTADATITADAGEVGDGGRVIVWADDYTRFDGAISARGGSAGGDGGFVETSGKQHLEARGAVDASAPAGAAGEWLLDPTDVSLQQVATTPGDDSSGGAFAGGTFTPTADTAIADVDQVVASLEGGTSVTIETASLAAAPNGGEITVDSPIAVTLNGGNVIFTLNAQTNILFNADLQKVGGANTLTLNLNAGIAGAGGLLDFLTATVSADSIVATGGVGADIFNLGAGNVSGTFSIAGGGGNDTVIGSSQTNTWNSSANNDGSVTFGATTANFSAIANLSGGVNVDGFTLGHDFSNVDGGSGTDSFTINGGTLATLSGGDGNDTFTLNADPGTTVNGGNQNDTFNINVNLANAVLGEANNDSFVLGAGGIVVTGGIDGGSGTDDVTGANASNTWNITGAEAFNETGGSAFTEIEQLTGGALDDRFNINAAWGSDLDGGDGADVFALGAGGSVGGMVFGGNGSDTLDLTAEGNAVTVNLQTGAAAPLNGGAAGGFTSIDIVTGSGDETLVGVDGAGLIFLVDGAGSGTFDAAGVNVAFSGVSNLTAGTGGQVFDINTGGSLAGVVTGTGTDTLDVSDAGLGALTVSLADSSVGPLNGGGAGGFSGIGTLVGSADGNDTLVGANVANTWSLSGPDDGSVGGIGFTDFGNLTAGTDTDAFVFADGASVSGAVDGSAAGADSLDVSAVVVPVTVDLQLLTATVVGSFIDIESVTGDGTDDTLVGANAAVTWDLGGTGTGVYDAAGLNVGFSNFFNLTGGTAADLFDFGAGASVAGTLDGGTGSDTADYADTGVVETIALGSLVSIETVTGSGDDVLVGTTTAGLVFVVDGANQGTFDGTGLNIAFSGISDLTAGTNGNVFEFQGATAALTGAVTGAAGPAVDTLNFADATLGALTVNLQAGTVGPVTGGFSNIDVVTGSGDETLVGADGAGLVFLVDGAGSGTFDAAGVNVAFSGVSNLTAGTGGQVFDINTGGSLAGVVTGTGTDTLDVSDAGLGALTVSLADGSVGLLNGGAAGGFSGIGTLVGSADGNDTLVGANVANTWSLSGPDDGSVGGIGFTDFGNLTAGTDTDAFVFADGASVSGAVDGSAAGADSLDVSAVVVPVTVDLQLLTATVVGSFIDIESVTGDGTDDTLVGANAAVTWDLGGTGTGVYDAAGLNVGFSNFFNLTGGTAADLFDFGAGASVAGTLDGGTGSDTADYADTGVVETIALGSLVSIETVTGSGDDVLVGTTTAGLVFVVDGANQGTFDGTGLNIAFSGISDLTAGTNGNVFEFQGATAALTGAVTGAAGPAVDTLNFADATLGALTVNLQAGTVGPVTGGFSNIDVVTGSGDETLVGVDGAGLVFLVDGAGSGTFDAATLNIAFSGVSNLTAGTGGQVFDINTGGSLAGVVTGQGTDTLDLSDAGLGALTVSLADGSVGLLNGGAAGGFSGITTLVGSADDTLVGADVANTWSLSGPDDGSVGGIGFTDFGNLTAGTDTDAFVFADGASVSGAVDGSAAGADSLDVSAVVAPVTVDLQLLTATVVGSFIDIESVTGDGTDDTLVGANADVTWDVTGLNSGTYDPTGVNVAFSGIANATGGSGDDLFDFGPTGSLSGNVDGGAQNIRDSFDFADRAAPVSVQLGNLTDIERVVGSAGADTLIALAGGVTFDVTVNNQGSAGGIAFESFEILQGGAGNDIFDFADGVTVTSVDGQGGTNTLDLADYVTGQVFNLTAPDSGTVNGVAFANTGGTLLNLVGSATGDDSYDFDGGGTLSGSITDGGGVADLLDLAGVTGTVTVNLATSTATPVGGTFAGIDAVAGNGAQSTLTAPDGGITITLSSENDGTAGTIPFTDFANLTGGTGNDIFQLNANVTGNLAGVGGDDRFVFNGGTVGGAIDGGASGATGDELDYAALAGPVTFDLGAATASLVTGTVGGIERFVGSAGSDTLIGTPGDDVFNVTANNAGNVAGTLTAFSSVENLAGGDGQDSFIFLDGVVVTSVAGGNDASPGFDTLDLTAYTSDLAWAITGSGTVNGIAFDTVERLLGSQGNDTFTVAAAGTLNLFGADPDIISGGPSGTDSVSYAARTTAVTVELANAISIESIIGGSGVDTLIGTGAGETFETSAANAGCLPSCGAPTIVYSAFENLDGAGGDDVFTLDHDVSGSVSGGAGNDDFFVINNSISVAGGISGGDNDDDFKIGQTTDGGLDAADVRVTLTANLDGGDGNDTFQIVGPGGGSVLAGNVVGDIGDDQLIFGVQDATPPTSDLLEDSRVTGNVDLGGGTDTIDLSGSDLFQEVLTSAGNGTIRGIGPDTGLDLIGGTFSGVETRIGNSKGSLTAQDDGNPNQWVIDGLNSGFLDGTPFSNFRLVGADDADVFEFRTLGRIEFGIDGGSGGAVNTVRLDSTGAFPGAILLTGPRTGELDPDTGDGVAATVFANIDVAEGGLGADLIGFQNAAVSFSGRVDGLAGSDTLDVSNLAGPRTLTFSGTGATDGYRGTEANLNGGVDDGFDNIDVITGTGTDRIIAPDTATFFFVDGANTGTVSTSDLHDRTGAELLAFSGVASLSGGTAADEFEFSAAGSLAGQIDGRAGDDKIDLGPSVAPGVTVVLQTGGSIDGRSGTVGALVAGFDNVNAVDGRVMDTLQVNSLNNNWLISGLDQFTLDGSTIPFTGFGGIAGGPGTDVFTFAPGGRMSVGISGAGGANTIRGSAGDDTVLALGGNAGTFTLGADTTNFSQIDSIDLLGQTGFDTIDLSILANPSVNLTTATVSGFSGTAIGFENIVGNPATSSNNTLTGQNNPNVWTIASNDGGSVDGIAFSSFGRIVGGGSTDAFNFAADVTLSGGLAGGAGIDTLNRAADTAATSINLTAGTATGIAGGITAIESFVGSATTGANGLLGSAGADTFSVSGTNSGVINGGTFANFQSLVGGGGADRFTIAAGGSLATGIGGGPGIDTITGNGINNVWTIAAVNSGTANGISFNAVENLTAVGGTTHTLGFTGTGSLTGLFTAPTLNVLTANNSTGGAQFSLAGNLATVLPSMSLASAGGNISVSGGVAGSGGVALNAGGGSATVGGPVQAGSVSFTAATISVNGVTTVGAQTYSGTTRLGGNLSGAALTFAGQTQAAGSILLESSTNVVSFGGAVTGVEGTSLTINPTSGTDLVIDGTVGAGRVAAGVFSGYLGHLIIGGILDPTTPAADDASVIEINANRITIESDAAVGGDVTLLASNIDLLADITADGTALNQVTMLAVGDTQDSGDPEGDITAPENSEVQINADRVVLIANNSIVNDDNIRLDLGGGPLLVAVGATADEPAFNPSSNALSVDFDPLTLQLIASLTNPIGVQAVQVIFINPAAALTGLQNVQFVDVGLFEEDLSLFGVIGNGIALSLDQCEETEGCAPSVSAEELEQLIAQLEQRIATIEQRMAGGALDQASGNTLVASFQAELANYRSYQAQLTEFLAGDDEFYGDFEEFDEEFADELGDDPDDDPSPRLAEPAGPPEDQPLEEAFEELVEDDGEVFEEIIEDEAPTFEPFDESGFEPAPAPIFDDELPAEEPLDPVEDEFEPLPDEFEDLELDYQELEEPLGMGDSLVPYLATIVDDSVPRRRRRGASNP